MYKIATFFNKNDWEKYGPIWIERASSQKLSGYLFFEKELEIKNKFKGFETLSCSISEKFCALSSIIKNESYLFAKPNSNPIEEISVSVDVFCGIRSDLNAFDASLFINNLYDRASIIKYLNNKKEILSCDYVLGTEKFWKCFAGFQRNLIRKEFLNVGAYKENSKDCDDILLNYFFYFFDFSLETFS